MIVNLEALPPDVSAEFAKLVRHEYVDKAQRAMREQRAIADHYDRNRPRSTDGLGGQTMALHPFLHWEAAQHFQDGNWSTDPDKVKWYLKHNPAAKVRATGTRIQVGYAGKAESGKRKAETEFCNRRSRTVFSESGKQKAESRNS